METNLKNCSSLFFKEFLVTIMTVILLNRQIIDQKIDVYYFNKPIYFKGGLIMPRKGMKIMVYLMIISLLLSSLLAGISFMF